MTTSRTPSDLEQALAQNTSAKAAWARLAPSHRREHLEAIEDAKRPETRARRIEKAVAMLADGERRPVTASTKGLAAKLLAKPGNGLAVLNAPVDASELLGPLPEGATVTTRLTTKADIVLLFARDSADLDTRLATVSAQLPPSATLWVAYPKGGKGITSDLNRDKLSAHMQPLGFETVSLVAVDDTWSAARMKRM